MTGVQPSRKALVTAVCWGNWGASHAMQYSVNKNTVGLPQNHDVGYTCNGPERQWN
jgi:hypothetical protein